MVSYEAARAKVIEVIRARPCAPPPATETIEFVQNPAQVLGRIVAENVAADRNYPPFNRSTRDGYAVRAADAAHAGAKLRLTGESRAGGPFEGAVEPGTCVQIMTGAPLPRGANAIVMNEYARVEGNYVIVEQPAREGAHYVLEGQETRVGESVLTRGKRVGYAELAIAAQVGRSKLLVAKKPRVAILSTGDEVIPVDQPPKKFQIRNSNNISLAAQVALAGGEPVMLGVVPDTLEQLRAGIQKALDADIVAITGGVSVGKYDLVEQVLRELGDGILLRYGGDSPRQARGFRFLQREAGVWASGESGLDYGDVRAVRDASDRLVERAFSTSIEGAESETGASGERKTAAGTFFARALELAEWRGDRRDDSLGRLGGYRLGGEGELLSGGTRVEAEFCGGRNGGRFAAPRFVLSCPRQEGAL